MKLKRVWDTTEKKIARVPWANWKPCQVWLKVEEEKFYKQDINWLVEITDEEFNVYWPNWKAMDSDDVLGYYDTDEPTELFSPEDWDEATYTFEDYDETVLKTGKVKDWETPVAPEDPTREGYTFTGWKPKVKAIYKDTTYTAQYEEDLCTVTILPKNMVFDEAEEKYVDAESQNPLYFTVEPLTVQVPEGCKFTIGLAETPEDAPDGWTSLDFYVSDGDSNEILATVWFTPNLEDTECAIDYAVDFAETQTEWIEVGQDWDYVITWDATIPMAMYIIEDEENS